MKKLLSLLLAMVMLLAATSALAEYPIVTEPLTLNVFQYELENQEVDFGNLWFYQELEKKTGIHVEFQEVKDSAWQTQLSLMFTSGEWPDLILSGDLDVEEYGVSQEILVPLDDYLEEYMPNYYSRLGMNSAGVALPASDGKMYTIGNLTAQGVNHDGTFFINQEWLTKLGLEIPTTVDELTEVLRAFKEGDPNGNGIADEIPFSAADLIHQTQGVYTHFAMFGVPLTRYAYACIDDAGTVVFPGDMPGFRAALEWLNLCYSEGLLDPESITQDSNVWGVKVNEDRVGFTTYLRTLNTAWAADIADNYQHILPPASEYGVSVPRTLEVASNYAAITVANEHIPETLRWLDAQFETETMMVSYNGPIQEGGPIAPTMKINDAGKYEILSVPENNGLYEIVPVYHAQFFAPADYYSEIYEMPPHRVERFNQAKLYEESGALETYSFNYLTRMVKLDNEDAIEQARLFTEIEKFMQESITAFITGGVTDENWASFQATAEAVGVPEYIELYQKGYDAYLAKTAE
ncbi:MAG: extracellular solute-binding protein [Oscillospiraceae bacterium]|jgi:putative aldouronate transport system substrate-binding protein|nr:extracellular solute-binding protein [Oscillospiraceae bacterium]